MTYEHPPPFIGQHKATVTSHQLGVRVSCGCGWSKVAGSQPRAALAFAAHVRDEKAKQGSET